jgi:hypothetical protein
VTFRPHKSVEICSNIGMCIQVPPKRPAEDILISRLARPHILKKSTPRLSETAAESLEIEAELHDWVEQLPGSFVQVKLTRRRFLEHTSHHQVSEHPVKDIWVAPCDHSQVIDVMDARSDVVGNAQGRSHVDAPGRAQVAQGPEVNPIWLRHIAPTIIQIILNNKLSTPGADKLR